MADRMKGKVVLVSGAGSVGPGWGNGKASAVVYAREGAQVFAVDRAEKAALETRDIIRGEGGTCEAWACDVTDEAAVESMAAACVAAFERVGRLVAKYVPPEVDLVEDLLEERRREAALE